MTEISSSTKKKIQLQKTYFQNAISDRITLLRERGLDKIALAKDVQLRRLKARLKQVNRRSSAVSQIEKRYEVLAQRKKEGPVQKPEKEATPKKSAKPQGEKHKKKKDPEKVQG